MKEADYKAATIDWLISKGYLDKDAVLINELPVDNFSRRADLVVANGKLHAFEIKSDADSLSRLEGQIETYTDFFDKVTLVCSPKFTQKAIDTLPKIVEILELNKDSDGETSLKVKRRGRIDRVENPNKFLSFVEKKYLVSALKQKKLACQSCETRNSLQNKISKLPKSYWRKLVLDYLKTKYRQTHDSFMTNKKACTDASDLLHLSPQRLQEQAESVPNASGHSDVWEMARECLRNEVVQGVDISENMNRFGFVTSKPVRVIPRSLKQAT
ncbi:sce7726 family protein [Vibrio parahaemolyticus]|nr:sce7726 family protein [Vibrio parahaemolyticus]